MKATVRLLALPLILILILTACGGGGLSGTYEDITGEREVTFRGSTAIFRNFDSSETFSTGYVIDNGFISFTITREEMQKMFDMMVADFGEAWQDEWTEEFDLDEWVADYNEMRKDLLFVDDGDRIFIDGEMYVKR
jgi:hypothetical protein